MFYRSRPSFLAVTAMALLLITAAFSVAAAQIIDPPPPPPGFNGGATLTPTPNNDQPPTPPGFNGGVTSTPSPTPNNDQPTPRPGFNGGGGGAAPPPTENGLIKPVIHHWPPPNAIVLHPATPIQLSRAGTGLRVYFIDRNGTGKIGPFFDGFNILANTFHGDPVTLYEGSNPGTGKPVTIDYLPAQNILRVSTYYADRPPHDINKPYVFTVDANYTVTHEQW